MTDKEKLARRSGQILMEMMQVYGVPKGLIEELRELETQFQKIRDSEFAYVSCAPTEIEVQAGAVVLATTPLIDAPKLSHNEWMGLSRQILEAARAISVKTPADWYADPRADE